MFPDFTTVWPCPVRFYHLLPVFELLPSPARVIYVVAVFFAILPWSDHVLRCYHVLAVSLEFLPSPARGFHVVAVFFAFLP